MATVSRVETRQTSAAPSIAVVEAVAAREGVDPVELDRPLNDVLDPDALDRLVRSYDAQPGASPFEVSFTYYGYSVTVSSSGTVRVDGSDTTRTP